MTTTEEVETVVALSAPPKLKKIVYSNYRELLDSYNNQTTVIDVLPSYTDLNTDQVDNINASDLWVILIWLWKVEIIVKPAVLTILSKLLAWIDVLYRLWLLFEVSYYSMFIWYEVTYVILSVLYIVGKYFHLNCI